MTPDYLETLRGVVQEAIDEGSLGRPSLPKVRRRRPARERTRGHGRRAGRARLRMVRLRAEPVS